VGDGQGTWFAVTGAEGRGQLRGPDNGAVDSGTLGRFEPTLFLYDNYPGGIGLSAPLFDAADVLVRDALDLVSACTCTAGCPACVGPTLPGDAERPLTPRTAALVVLRLLAGDGAAQAAGLPTQARPDHAGAGSHVPGA
jgi:DEAD/DEAH box helicase domain-containing protein